VRTDNVGIRLCVNGRGCRQAQDDAKHDERIEKMLFHFYFLLA